MQWMSGRTTKARHKVTIEATQVPLYYSQSQTDMAETGELTEMLKALLEDRKTLEADLREERRVRAEETAEEMREQMDLLRGLVEGAHGEGGSERRVTSRDLNVAVAKLTDADDIEVTFERLMSAYDVPANRWVFKLAPQLSGNPAGLCSSKWGGCDKLHPSERGEDTM